MESPLSSFVNSHSIAAVAPHRHQSSSPTQIRSPFRSVIPTKYDPRQSDDQLERLISQSKSHLVSNLLLDDARDLPTAPAPPIYVDPSRPLTSAGRKVTSRGEEVQRQPPSHSSL
jgi:hypothetical protein